MFVFDFVKVLSLFLPKKVDFPVVVVTHLGILQTLKPAGARLASSDHPKNQPWCVYSNSFSLFGVVVSMHILGD